MQKPEYLAFISYRHADNRAADRCWATWLHRALEAYVVPPDLVGTADLRGGKVPGRIYPVFRDEEEFSAEAALAPAIRDALERSRLLIVLCSPRAVESPYVAEEIRHFKSLGRGERIIPVLLDGEPGHAEREAFPEPLRQQFSGDGSISAETVEPLAADFRLMDGTEGYTSAAAYERRLREAKTPGAVREAMVSAYRERCQLAFLKIVSAVLAVPLATLTRRDQAHQLAVARRRARIFRAVAAALTLLLAIAVGTGIYANRKRVEATKARDSANDLVGFMLTDLHDQLSQTGRLDVLSSTVEKVDRHLAENPVPPRLVADLRLQQARILFGQGRLREAVERAQGTLGSLPDGDGTRAGRAKLHAFLGDVLAWENTRTAEAEAECLKALGLFDATATDPAAVEALVRTHIALGDIQRDEERIPEALASYGAAGTLAATVTPVLDETHCLALRRTAEVCHLNNQPERAVEAVREALALVQGHLSKETNSHPWLVAKAETLQLRSSMERYAGRTADSHATLLEAETCAEQTATPGQLHRIFLLASLRGQLAAHASPTPTLPQREHLFTEALHAQRGLCREDPQNRGWAGKLASTLRDRAGFRMELAELFKDDAFRVKAVEDLREAAALLAPADLPGTLRERAETAVSLAAAEQDGAARAAHLERAAAFIARMPAGEVETLALSALLDLFQSPPRAAEAHGKLVSAWGRATGIRRVALAPQLAASHMRLASAEKDADAFKVEAGKALAVLRSVKVAGGDQPDLDERICLTLGSTARTLQKLDHQAEAADLYGQAAGILRGLVVRYPSYAPPFREISLAEYQLGKIASGEGDEVGALALLRSSFTNYRTFIRTASLETPRPPSPTSLPNITALNAITGREAEAATHLGRHAEAAEAWGRLLGICREVDAATLSGKDKEAFGKIHAQALTGAIHSLAQLDQLSPDQAAEARAVLVEAEKAGDFAKEAGEDVARLRGMLDGLPAGR